MLDNSTLAQALISSKHRLIDSQEVEVDVEENNRYFY